ncbi:MAG: MerR family DNA-binding transcriptional regulator [Candidatus Helarchaeota archaeon]
MSRYYRISEAASLLGVCTKTVRRWDALGKVECKRTVGGHRRISILEIGRLLTGVEERSREKRIERTAIYCRVSSHDRKKKGDLDRRVDCASEYCKKNGYNVGYIFKDVGTGLNTRRYGLKKMCKLIDWGY